MIRVVRETHETPESVQRRLLLAGGVNRFGEPNYRAVWGWNRLDWIGGKWEDRDENGTLVREVFAIRREPKYPALNRWHIEKWMPPEFYGTPETWHLKTLETERFALSDGERTELYEYENPFTQMAGLGPYPSRGEYEHCFTLEDARGGFVQLTATVAERIARAIELAGRFPRSARKAALYRREEKADEDYVKWAYDVLDDGVPAFHKQPFVTVA